MKLFKKKNNIDKTLKHEKLQSLSWSNSSSRTDWTITIGAVFILLVILLAWSWKMFHSINTGTYFDISIDSRNTGSVIDTERLDRVLENFKDRSRRFIQLTGGMVLTNIEDVRIQESEPIEEISEPEPALENSTSTESIEESTGTSTETFDLEE